jgi:hypothetical protein
MARMDKYEMNHWTCSRTRLVLSQVSQIWCIFCKNPPNLPFFSGSCSITEVIEQLYCEYLVPVRDVDTLWTECLKNRIFAAFKRENAKAVHDETKFRTVTDFVDRHYLVFMFDCH